MVQYNSATTNREGEREKGHQDFPLVGWLVGLEAVEAKVRPLKMHWIPVRELLFFGPGLFWRGARFVTPGLLRCLCLSVGENEFEV